jgi:CRISPR/Cas system-associated endoribonuclease Cas2
VPVKTEYYDKDGNLKKVKTVSNIYKQGAKWVQKTILMQNVQNGHQTLLNIVESKQEAIDDYYFSEQFLLQTDRL